MVINHPKILRFLLTIMQSLLAFWAIENLTFINILLFIILGCIIEDIKVFLKSKI